MDNDEKNANTQSGSTEKMIPRIWEEFLAKEEKTMGKEVIDRWLRPLAITHFNAMNLYLEASDPLQLTWFKEHIEFKVRNELVNNNGHKIKVHVSLGKSIDPPPLIEVKGVTKPSIPLIFASDSLDAGANFETFQTNKNTLITLQILKGMLLGQTELLNPIYIHGPTGSGKTHLLMGAQKLLESKGKKALFVNAETFTTHVVSAIRTGRMEEFRNLYRNIDALIIDDIDRLQKRFATQEELFHTFNTLHIQEKPILLASSNAPRLLEEIEERLISRFEWGITLALERLTSKEELYHVVETKCRHYALPLSQEIKDMIAQEFPSARSIEKAILSLSLASTKMNLKKCIEVKEYLAKLLIQERQETLSKEKILEIVACSFGIQTDDLLTKSQTRESVLPRQISMYLLRSLLKMPYIKIGNIFSKDHSTVMSSIKQVNKGMENQDQDLMFHMGQIQRKLVNLG